jgi:integrase
LTHGVFSHLLSLEQLFRPPAVAPVYQPVELFEGTLPMARSEALTQAKVNKLAWHETTGRGGHAPECSYADGVVPGLSVVVRPSGHRSFRLQYRLGKGRSARKATVVIGSADRISLDEARKQARAILHAVADGRDPQAERRVERESVTVKSLADAFLAAKRAEGKSSATLRDYGTLLEKYLVPALGTRRAHDVARQDVQRLVSKLRESHPAQAVKMCAVVSSLYAWGGKHHRELDGVNPAKGIDKPGAKQFVRKRATIVEDLGLVGNAVSDLERERKIDERSAAAIRLLALTGCRLREILTLKWSYVDWAGGYLHLPETKTGARSVALNSGALAVLRGLEQIGDYVFPGDSLGKPRVDLKRPWRKVIAAAGCDGFRIHDLRHGFATIGAGSGAGLPLIGKLLGHTQAATTHRYADVHADPQRRLSETIGAAILERWSGHAPENVVPLARKAVAE